MIPDRVCTTVKNNMPKFKQYKNIGKEQLFLEMENYFREEIIMNNLDRKEFREKLKEIYKKTY